MKRILPGLLVVLALLAGGRPVTAQPPYGPGGYGPGGLRPGFGFAPTQPVSPYINILRAGAPFGVNYYNIVQPQLQFQASLSNLQQQTTQLETGTAANAFPATGHAAFFDNQLHYYGRRPGSTGAGTSGGPGIGPAPLLSGAGRQGTPGRAPTGYPGTGRAR
jgi:hypothetical protein